MMTDSSGVSTRVDTAEQDLEVRRNKIAEPLMHGSLELFLAGLPRNISSRIQLSFEGSLHMSANR